MKPNEFRKVQVNITTYKKDIFNEHLKNMNVDKNRRNKDNNNKFVCSICLNSKDKNNDNNRKNSKSCPICQRSCDICTEKAQNKTEKAKNDTQKVQIAKMNLKETNNTETKSVQTVQTDLNKSLNLLNEVLTVFQSKKVEQVKSKTVILKDASVSTEDVRTLNSKLSVSKVFQLSIDRNSANDNGKFIVMSSKIESKRSNIDLIRNKSSSVPQMKLEELKYSLKEKTKAKDIVEEVNRMFATVKRNHTSDNLNRPSIRSGPRILPVVETIADHNKITEKSCKCCQTNCMSSGDSIKCWHKEKKCDIECCPKKDDEVCEKCVYMLCYHYKNCQKIKAGVMVCERCREVKTHSEQSEHSFADSG